MQALISTKVAFPLIGLSMLILHGLEDSVRFKVDTVTVLLLFFSFTPHLGSFIEKVKAGEYEVSFGKKTAAQTLLGLLKTLSQMRRLTNYKPREPESPLSEAHRLLVKHLIEGYKDDLHDELKKWLATENDNIRWMASEIIGYYELSDLKSHLLKLYDGTSQQVQWPEWKLNCLWAHSRIDNSYQEMHTFLNATRTQFNQDWLLGAYEQMSLKGHCDDATFLSVVTDFLKKEELTQEIRTKALQVMSTIQTVIGTGHHIS